VGNEGAVNSSIRCLFPAKYSPVSVSSMLQQLLGSWLAGSKKTDKEMGILSAVYPEEACS